MFVCAPATALIVSSIGEVEVFSKDQKCNKKVLEFSTFGGEGRSIDLLDDQLVLLGDSTIGNYGAFAYKSVAHPRKGLLGMSFTTELAPVGNSPRWHTSHAYGNLLLAIGGEFQSEAKLSSKVWTTFNFHQNGFSFASIPIGACKVKLEREIFLVIGGLGSEENPSREINTVLRLNIIEETVELLPQIKKRRAFHSCEVFHDHVLISGGTEGNQIVVDEIYNTITNKAEVLKKSSSLRRHRHQLLRLEETIFSFGGLTANGLSTAEVKWFDWTRKKWKKHEHSLLSSNMSNLAVVPFPMSAVDCHAGCSCGIKGKAEPAKIVGGSNAEVILLRLFSSLSCVFAGAFISLDGSADQGRGQDR